MSPYPVPLNRPVQLTVQLRDAATGTDAAGQMVVDGVPIGQTNTAITYTFRPKRRRVSVRPPEWEVTYPTGRVTGTGFPDITLDFGFPDV